jgi:type I restriction enzyme R subunit
MPSPEELAREKIDALLKQCGWALQKRSTINLSASRGVAIREALLKDRDEVDYLLFVDGNAIGTVEAKSGGYTLARVEEQSGKYGIILRATVTGRTESVASITCYGANQHRSKRSGAV